MKSKIFVLIYFLLFLPSACYPVRYDGPYEGKIVDADSEQPIEGVVVLGVWYKETATVAGAVGSYYDAMETTTDKNGDFKITGLGLKVLSNVAPMDVLIFKAGYEYIGLGPWDSFKEDEILKKKVRWEGRKVLLALRKLKMEERKSPPAPPSETPLEKVILMLREIDKSDMERGLPPRKFWGGKHYE